ncbi:MAG: hypothetical protein QXL77_05090 [Candidatus Bathyarchaeia archaeon]|nr:hypothetical protein [Candidatus Bathyarchaeota archaeon]
MYAVWIKIDEALPWIELKGTYETKGEAQKAAKETLKTIKVKIVKVDVERKPLKAAVIVKR